MEAPAVPAAFWRHEPIRDAVRARHMGQLVRAYRTHPHHGRHPLPQEVVAGWLGITQAQLSRIERGPPMMHLDRLIHWARVLQIPATCLWFSVPDRDADRPGSDPLAEDPTATAEAAAAADTVQVTVRLDGTEVALTLDRRTLVHTGFGSILDALALGHAAEPLDQLGAQPDLGDRLALASPAHLEEILAHVREQWHALVKLDNLLGPRFALGGVRNQLALCAALLPVTRDGVRTSIVRQAAQYAESAAWLYEDADDLTHARYWAGRAMEWALEADDRHMVAWTVFRRSQQAAAAGDAAQTLSLAHAAGRDDQRLPTPMRAAIRVQQARGHALDRDASPAMRLLDDAHRWAATDATGDAREGHGSYCTDSYIELQRAGCWLTLGQATQAITAYEQALPDLPVVYQRDRAAALSGLAAAYAADGEPEQAARTAHAALPIARSAGSNRILRGLAAVGASLEPQSTLPPVAALLDDLAVGSR